jgi:glutamine synthetase
VSGSTARLQAISAVTNFKASSPPLNFHELSSHDLFGANVFSMGEMQKRADVVATAMKDWAIEKGAPTTPTSSIRSPV